MKGIIHFPLSSSGAAPDPARTTGDVPVLRATIARGDPDRATVANAEAVTKETLRLDSEQNRFCSFVHFQILIGTLPECFKLVLENKYMYYPNRSMSFLFNLLELMKIVTS